MQHHDLVYWITGASSGIGEALAITLSESGYRLILSARRKEELERVRSLCRQPDKVKILPIDLSEYSRAGEWAESAIGIFGQVDVLISNGGLGQYGTVIENDWTVEEKIIDVNLLGTMAVTKSVLPHMIERGSGRIVGIASIAGKFGQPKLAAYSASKAGVILWLESLREEVFDKGIVVQCVSPGFINTNVTLNSLSSNGSVLNKNSPAQENGMPAKTFAKKMMKVMAGKRFHHYIGRRELLAVPLHAWARSLFYKLLRRSYR